jgi:non-ribosomal peptide synthetase-like protein
MTIAEQNGPDPSLLHALFEATADRHPDRVALICGNGRLTYGELESRANRLAHYLRSLGVGKESFVAFLLPRGVEAFVALLGALKAGAAYVPLDPDYPAERVAYILADCGAAAVVTTEALAAKCGDHRQRAVLLDTHGDIIRGQPGRRLTAADTGLTPGAACYVIYTSGSTGRPKGVLIEHRSACHLVRAEGELFGVRPDDCVYQGFSLAFDASVEEVWLAFFAGAALVVGTAEWVRSGPELAPRLAAAGVTVFSTVPTLLSLLDDDIPTVRLLILGGEACPQELVARWCRPGRRMVNTYGPTEATVIATYADCDPARPITIGKAVPGYHVCLLDERLCPVPPGVVGEIHIGGPGVGRGYVGRDDLTRERFVANPADAGGSAPRLYKTGDLGRLNADGDIEFMGRADTQVKLRGFRIELTEIESALLGNAAVRAAAVTVREDIPGARQLVGYVVPRDGLRVDEQHLRGLLRAHLPSYMVPAVIDVLPALPALPSGKVDRRALPPPRGREIAARPDHVPPRTRPEEKIVAAWEKLFTPARVSVRDDFFTDLGGHSLLAAGMVSELRRDPQFAALSMRDVYDHPTVEELAAHLEATTPAAEPARKPIRKASSLAYWLTGLVQLPALYGIMAVSAIQWLAPYLVYSWLVESEYDDAMPLGDALHFGGALAGGLLAAVVTYPALLALAVAVKWVVIGRFKAGTYPLWSWYYVRWWVVRSFLSVVPAGYLAGSPLLALYYRLLGAKIGPDVHLGTDEVFTFDLVAIGAGTCVGTDTFLLGYAVEDGLLKVGPVGIGRDCFVGNRSVVREGTTMGDGAALEDLSLLPAGAHLPAGERWAGSPARPLPPEADVPPVERRKPVAGLRRAAFTALHAAGALVMTVLIVSAIFPGMMLMNYLNYADDYYWYLLASPFVGLSFVLLLATEIVVLKWLLLGRVRPGTYPLHGWFYWRKWFVDKLLELSLDVLGPLYATLYLAPWYRLLGAKIGRRAEVSTASFISPDLLEIDDEGFIADAVALGAPRIERGTMRIGRCRVGKRSFVGNSALLPPDSVLGDNCLVGCQSTLPPVRALAAKDDTDWLGSPAFPLRQRQKSTAYREEQTFNPPARLWLLRATIELFRVSLPLSAFIVLASLILSAVVLLQDEVSATAVALLFPLLYAAAALAAVLFTTAVKWVLKGRYRPGERPLWSPFVWTAELVATLQEHLADLMLLDALRGTPFLSPFLRLLGAKVGRRAYIETTDMTEYDLVTIGDDVALNRDCTVQTHLFEDRVMKMSTVAIGDGCSVGAVSLVLYDTALEAGSSLGSLSLQMKGEVLPAGSAWEGIPARHTSGLGSSGRRVGSERQEGMGEVPRATGERVSSTEYRVPRTQVADV